MDYSSVLSNTEMALEMLIPARSKTSVFSLRHEHHGGRAVPVATGRLDFFGKMVKVTLGKARPIILSDEPVCL